MALYRYSAFVHQATEHSEWDKLYKPGQTTAWSGIYRCHVCGHEIVHTVDKPLPPQNHHTHPAGQPIQWRLIVTDYTKKS